MWDVFSTIRLSLTTLAKALEDRDVEALKRLRNVRNDTIGEIDELQDRCLREIALRQPFGKDFRKLAALLKISTSLERIARYISHAAEYALEASNVPDDILDGLVRMAKLADKALSDSLEAFIREDSSMLRRSEELEEELDKEFKRSRDKIISRGQSSCEVRQAILLSLMARSVERIGDHAVEIVRWTEYYLKGRPPHG